MRFFSFIFSIYFLALAMLPCSDNDHCLQLNKNTTDCIQANDCKDTRHSDEICSPLCICSCCGGVTIVSNSDNSLIAQVSSEQLIFYSQNSPAEISFSIWQPPKI